LNFGKEDGEGTYSGWSYRGARRLWEVPMATEYCCSFDEVLSMFRFDEYNSYFCDSELVVFKYRALYQCGQYVNDSWQFHQHDNLSGKDMQNGQLQLWYLSIRQQYENYSIGGKKLNTFVRLIFTIIENWGFFQH